MVQKSFVERYESLVLLFADKVVLAAVVPLLVLLVANPMNLDRPQQASAAITILAIGYFVAHTIEKTNAAKIPPGPTTLQQPASTSSGPATTEGDHSPAVTGNGNSFRYETPPPPKKKPMGTNKGKDSP